MEDVNPGGAAVAAFPRRPKQKQPENGQNVKTARREQRRKVNAKIKERHHSCQKSPSAASHFCVSSAADPQREKRKWPETHARTPVVSSPGSGDIVGGGGKSEGEKKKNEEIFSGFCQRKIKKSECCKTCACSEGGGELATWCGVWSVIGSLFSVDVCHAQN
uniref:(northern house mosquito) hypothetical protein n=1 Tax=Culex pipiens TaxID=7175 RepID=A0A8D8LBW6_CULPI